jgi:flagellar motility protein MotE (MotC chaperone)
MRRLRLRPVRLLPLTLATAGVLLVVKLVGVTCALSGLAPAAWSIADARAESARPAPVAAAPAPPEGAASGHSAGETRARQRDAASAGVPIIPTVPLPSPQEIAVLQQLASRREALDARAQELDRREDTLRAVETRLDGKLAQLQALEATLQNLIHKQDEQQEAKLRSLVKICENMKPKDAARIFEELDDETLLPVAERMNERKLAPVMAEMNRAKAKAMTVELAKLRQMVSGARAGAAG